MVNVYDGLEDILLKEFDEADKNATINDVLDYSLHNSDENADFSAWERGTERFINDNICMLREWDTLTGEC
ncbi:hypothetical protein R80B4_01389 [Fibrobacteres bacterium R8-0-B4]